MDSFFCSTCGEFRTPSEAGRHKCQPVWFARLYEEGITNGGNDSELKKVYARSAEEAAEAFCLKWDAGSGEYDIVREGIADVLVYDKDKLNPVVFNIEARSEPVYNASQWRRQPAFGTVTEAPAPAIPADD